MVVLGWCDENAADGGEVALDGRRFGVQGLVGSVVDAVEGDFRLQLTSPMIDAGTDVDVTTDFAGKVRPRGGGHDIGAFESVIELVAPEGVGASLHTSMPGTSVLRLPL